MMHQNNVAQLGNILGLWAHPDDEVFSSAGLMMQAIQNGQRIVLITATKGDAGKSADEKRWPQKELTSIRQKELKQSLSILGVHEHHWLDYNDGHLGSVDAQKALAAIKHVTLDYLPDTIVSFEKHGITGHEDHKTVHRWATLLAQKYPHKPKVLCAVECREFYEEYGRDLHDEHNVYFNVDCPHTVCRNSADICVQLSKEQQQKKLHAIAAHQSQTASMFNSPESLKALEAMIEYECFMFV